MTPQAIRNHIAETMGECKELKLFSNHPEDLHLYVALIKRREHELEVNEEPYAVCNYNTRGEGFLTAGSYDLTIGEARIIFARRGRDCWRDWRPA